MRVISLGWGVQSFALAAMSALGELPPVDAAIHADTTHERRETYEFAEWWTPWLEERGVRVVTVRAARAGVIENWTRTSLQIPAYTTYENGTPGAMLRRQCTHDWKIAPIRKWLQKNREKSQVEMCMGITLDEWTRMRDSDVKYIRNAYPFMEQFKSPMSRHKVVRWLLENGLEIPVKSSCVFCPFRSHAGWREMKLSDNGDWKRAVDIDRKIRNQVPNYVAYLHRWYTPLEDVDLRNEQDHGQLELWSEECTGMCFL